MEGKEGGPGMGLFELWNELDEVAEGQQHASYRTSTEMKNRALSNSAVLRTRILSVKQPSRNLVSQGVKDLLQPMTEVTQGQLVDQLRSVKLAPIPQHTRTQFRHEIPLNIDYHEHISLKFVQDMVNGFQQGGVLSNKVIQIIFTRAVQELNLLPNCVRVTIPHGSKLTIVGDLHGQYHDLTNIFQLNGMPSPRNWYVFNGDWVDRGPNATEIVFTLLAFFLLYPGCVHLNRGNHESEDMNVFGGFQKECLLKYEMSVWEDFNWVFSHLPICTLIQGKVLVVHGGIPSSIVSLGEIDSWDRRLAILPQGALVTEMLWSDPSNDITHTRPSPRGEGVQFGNEAVTEFMKNNELALIVRSHQCEKSGYREWFGGKVVTVFSATLYGRAAMNQGAFLILTSKLERSCVSFGKDMSQMAGPSELVHHEVVCKLFRLVSRNRLALLDYYATLNGGAKESPTGNSSWITLRESDHSKTTNSVISRAQWAKGLAHVLGTPNVPFLEFQTALCLPDLGVRGEFWGDIDYLDWLDKFRPKNLDPRMVEKATPAIANRSLDSVLNELLYSRRRELRTIFQFFDVENRGVLSTDDILEGVQSLCDVLKVHVPRERIRRYADRLAPEGKEVDYESFIGTFSAESKRLKADHDSQHASDDSDDSDHGRGKRLTAAREKPSSPKPPDENEQFRNLKEFF